MTESELEAWFSATPDNQRETLRMTRNLIKSLGPEVIEELKWGRPCYSAKRGLFCYLQSTKNHVSLGFQQGTSLDDPRGLLQGAGQEMRHVKLKPGHAPDHDALLELLNQAYRNAS
jgi:hypothetical protein